MKTALALTQVSLTALSDAELASHIGLGDARALELMMRRHNRLLYRTARSILRDDAEAEDCVQEAYMQAFRSIGGFRADSKLSTWLTRIVINQALGKVRKNKKDDANVSFDNVLNIDGHLPGANVLPPHQILSVKQLFPCTRLSLCARNPCRNQADACEEQYQTQSHDRYLSKRKKYTPNSCAQV